MARFYDSASDADLGRVEGILEGGGIEYSLRVPGKGSQLKEIVVAEEDLIFAELLLSGSADPHK